MPMVVTAALAGVQSGFDVVLSDAFRRCAGQLGDPPLLPAEQSVVADPPVTQWHEMSRETADEGRPRQSHLTGSCSVAVVLPFEADRFVLLVDTSDALVADRDPAGVAGQVTHHRTGVTQGLATENVPTLGGKGQPPVAPPLKALDRLRPLDVGRGFKLLDLAQHDATEHFRHGFDRKQIVATGLGPMTIAVAAPSGTDQHMQVRMPVERPAPSVEHPEECSVHLPVVALESYEGFGGGGKQKISGLPVVAGKELVKFLGDREDHMEMRTVRQTFANLFGPLRLARSQAARTMAVATGTGVPFGMVALPALGAVEPEFAVAAVGHEIECRIATFSQTTRPEMPPLAKYVIDGRLHTVHLNSIRADESSTISPTPT